MMTVTLEEARARLGELVNTVRLSGQPVTITRYGKPAVTIVPAGQDDGPVTDQGEGGGS
jgi:prevent-host-death family protein